MKSRKELGLLGFLIVLTAAIYAQVIHFDFVRWDDNVFIFENRLMFMPFAEAMKVAFTSLYNRDYLPISLLSWWIDCWIGGGPSAAVSHFGNLALHLTNIGLLWVCLRPLVSEKTNFFVCLIFALHPLQVESVALASSRNNILCATFALLAILCAQRLDRGWKQALGYSAFFVLGLLSKAIIVFTPLILILCDRIIHRRPWKKVIRRHVIPTCFAVGMVMLRVLAYGHSNSKLSEVSLDLSRFAWVPIQAMNAVGFYFSSLFVPNDLAIIYPLFEVNGRTWFQVALVLVIMALTWIQWRRTRSAALLLSVGWTFFYFLPVLQIIPRLNYVNDRYVYMPIAGMALWIALTAQWLVGHQRILAGATGILALALSFLSWRQISIWRDDLIFWRHTTTIRPDSAVARMNLATTYERMGLIDEAIVEYEKASRGRYEEDTSAQALSNLALVHSKVEYPRYYNLHLALQYMKLAEAQPIDETSRFYLRYNRARMESLVGNKQMAREMAEKLLKDLEGNPDSMLNDVRQLAINLIKNLN